jgi:hypothetical protein
MPMSALIGVLDSSRMQIYPEKSNISAKGEIIESFRRYAN